MPEHAEPGAVSHCRMAAGDRGHGWIAITPGSPEQIPEEQRRHVEQWQAEREEARGRLLADVSVESSTRTGPITSPGIDPIAP